MALRDDPDFLALIKRVEALYLGKDTANFQIAGEAHPRAEPNAVKASLTRIEAKEGVPLTDEQINAIADAVAEQLSEIDHDMVVKAVRDGLTGTVLTPPV